MTTRKAVAAAFFVSVTAIPMAAGHAGEPHGKQACKPNVSVMLKGTLANDPAAGATTLMMSVTGSNAHGKSLKGLGVTVALDAKTKVRRQGAKTVESLAMNDRVNVQIRRCKADLPLSAATVDDVAAARITAQAP
jgi:hypothetical protein